MDSFEKRIVALEQTKQSEPAILTMADGSTVKVRGTKKHIDRLHEAAFDRLEAWAAGLPMPESSLDTELDLMAECAEVSEDDGQMVELLSALLKSSCVNENQQEKKGEMMIDPELLKRIAAVIKDLSRGPLTLCFADGSERSIPGDIAHLDLLFDIVRARIVAEVEGEPVPTSLLDYELEWVRDCIEIVDREGMRL